MGKYKTDTVIVAEIVPVDKPLRDTVNGIKMFFFNETSLPYRDESLGRKKLFVIAGHSVGMRTPNQGHKEKM